MDLEYRDGVRYDVPVLKHLPKVRVKFMSTNELYQMKNVTKSKRNTAFRVI